MQIETATSSHDVTQEAPPTGHEPEMNAPAAVAKPQPAAESGEHEPEMSGGAGIEDKCGLLRKQRDLLSDELARMNAKIERAKMAHIDTIRDLAAAAAQTTDELLDLVEDEDALFEVQRSMTIHGIKCGWRKARGKVEYDDEAKVVMRIEQTFQDDIGVLIKTTRKPNKSALLKLAASDLKRLGVEVSGAGDETFVSDTATDIDKMVDRIINEASGAPEAA